tara:strand:- start:225 stop:701 length:477 start_codon:yes stop_codon:yes gene_type:complete
MYLFKNRPTFIYQNQPVRAAGILLYYILNNQRIYLFRIVDKNRATDIGGCTDKKDKDYFDTACREAAEETNGHFFSINDSIEECQHKFLTLLKNVQYEIKYDNKGKYVLFEIEVSKRYSKNMKRFGKIESTDKMKHYYIWKSLDKIYNIHPRLKNILK